MAGKPGRGRDGESGRVRIAAGEWRSRVLRFPDLDGLRPTGDRQRQMLFNWLQAEVPGSRVVDLFAGSGALGFEAASRGAESVLLVEKHPRAAAALRANAELLGAAQVTVLEGDAWRFLDAPPLEVRADLLLVDPPFERVDYAALLERIGRSTAVAPGALVYLETPIATTLLPPEGWQNRRERCTGSVRMQLLRLPTKKCD